MRTHACAADPARPSRLLTIARGSISAAVNRPGAGKPVDCCTADTTSCRKRKGGRARSSAVRRGLPSGSSGCSACTVASHPAGGSAMAPLACRLAGRSGRLGLGIGRVKPPAAVGGVGGWLAATGHCHVLGLRNSSPLGVLQVTREHGQRLESTQQHGAALTRLLMLHRIHFNRNSAPADRQGLPRGHPRSSARSAPARPLGSDIGMAFSFGATPGASVSALLPDSPLRLLESALPGAPGGSGERASHHMTLSHRSASPAAPCGHSTTAAACAAAVCSSRAAHPARCSV